MSIGQQASRSSDRGNGGVTVPATRPLPRRSLNPYSECRQREGRMDFMRVCEAITRLPGGRAGRSKGSLAFSVVVLTSFAVLAAGCGSGARTPAVANLGAAASTSATGAPPPSGSRGQNYSDAMAYSECMRTHHLPDFPDPDSRGRLLVNVHPGSDLLPSSHQYQSANKACRHLLPNDGQQTAAQAQQQLAQLLRYSHCMRSHGVQNFPDPTFTNGHASLLFERGGAIDPSAPQFRNAQEACRSLSPGG